MLLGPLFASTACASWVEANCIDGTRETSRAANHKAGGSTRIDKVLRKRDEPRE